jgi:hypothetical protein
LLANEECCILVASRDHVERQNSRDLWRRGTPYRAGGRTVGPIAQRFISHARSRAFAPAFAVRLRGQNSGVRAPPLQHL